MRKGGLGLRAATRMAPAAYCESWADELPIVHERLPGVAHNAVPALEGDDELESCLGALRVAVVGLDRQGFRGSTYVGNSSDGSTITTNTRHRTKGMGPRLATLRGFRFNTTSKSP